MKKFTLWTIDKKISFTCQKAFIYTPKYTKEIGKNEAHNPLVCKLIVKTQKSLFQFLLVKSIIITQNNNIEVNTISEFDKVTQKVPYFSENSEKFKFLEKIYNAKKVFELSNQELIDKDFIKTFNELQRVLEIEVPLTIGGGF